MQFCKHENKQQKCNSGQLLILLRMSEVEVKLDGESNPIPVPVPIQPTQPVEPAVDSPKPALPKTHGESPLDDDSNVELPQRIEPIQSSGNFIPRIFSKLNYLFRGPYQLGRSKRRESHNEYETSREFSTEFGKSRQTKAMGYEAISSE